MRIGVFGGSFNPIHNGHLKLAREAVSKLNLDRVIFVPSYQTPLKSPRRLLPWRVRVRLLRAALGKNPRYAVSLCEVKREGVSFTVDTLRYFKKRFGPRTELFFLAGADTLGSLGRWKSWREVTRLCRFVVWTRPGFRLKTPPGVWRMPLDALPISSSQIRGRLKAGRPLTGLVPAGVARRLRSKRMRSLV